MADSVDNNIRIDINMMIAEMVNKILKDSEEMSEDEIYEDRYISINGKVSLADIKIEGRVDNSTKIGTISGTVYPGRIHPSIN